MSTAGVNTAAGSPAAGARIVNGTRAIVTGAAGGIGAALAAELISRGATVVLADISATVADTASALNTDTASGFESGAHAWVGDVSSVAGIDELIAFADDRLGGVDMYFANAGIIGPGELGENDADWDAIIDVNLRAHIRAAQALIPRWQEAGEGHFVATASAAGLLTQIGSAAYSV
ncbi:MAG: SDR family oxidoreductase, partial [Brevibacterium sp.]|nr:SDR family oxidoreductase [Brevibacterium sp.]